MPRIEPYSLLKCLCILLSPSGGIRSKEEVNRIASLMTKFSKKLVSKCIYTLILKSTDIDLLDMFMSAGGWDLTFSWLSDGIHAKNWPFIVELVELLLICPVDIERLKGNNCPKLIKLLSKDVTATETVRALACKVVEQWLAIVKGACEEPPQTPVAPSEEALEQEDVVDENGVDEMIVDEDSGQLPVYKITIRDGQKVLAEVISSDRTAPRVDSVKQSDDKVMCSVISNIEPIASSSRTPAKRMLEDNISGKLPNKVQIMTRQLTESDDETVKPAQVRKKRVLNTKKETLRKKTEKKTSPSHDPDYIIKPPLGKKTKPSELKKMKIEMKKDKSKDEKKDEKQKPKEKQKEKSKAELDEQTEKDKATLAKLITPSIVPLGKIPKKVREEDDKDKKTDRKPVEPSKPPPKDPKKYNISVETRKGVQDRPKTVKTYNSKFRSTGLEEVPPPPKSIKKSEKKDEEEKKTVKRPSPPKDVAAQPPPEKKPKEDEKKVEKAVTPPKSKIMFLQESDVFADALTAANPVKDTKKRKRRTSLTNEVKKEGSLNGGKSEDKKPNESVKPVFKFYQDTLVTSEDKKGEDKTETCDGKIKSEIKEEPLNSSDTGEVPNEENACPSSPVSKEELEDEVAKAEEAINQVLKMEEKKNVEREKNRLARGILTYVKKRKGLKKNVQWKPDSELETTKYFELDETERVNVTKPFTDMKHLERISEREHILLSRKLAADDIMEEKTVWRPLIPVDILGEQIIPGKNSLEKEVQYARERTTLQAIYFNRRMIPDSPSEPDFEVHATTDPVVIPLEDQTGNAESVISYKGKPWPEPKGYPPGIERSGIESPPQGAVSPGFVPIMAPQQPPFQAAPPFAFQPPPTPEWMGGAEMMMCPPGMMGPPPPAEMYPMGPPPPEFMPPPPFMGPPPPGMFAPPPGPPGPPFPHPPTGPEIRPHRPPWFRQNGGPPAPAGTWRHPSKGGNWNNKGRGMCNNFMKKGYCRINKCPYRHPPGNNR